MSKTDEKQTPAQQAQNPAGANAVALVQSAQAPQTVKADQDHGRGGIYVIKDGVRQRQGGTQRPADKKEQSA